MFKTEPIIPMYIKVSKKDNKIVLYVNKIIPLSNKEVFKFLLNKAKKGETITTLPTFQNETEIIEFLLKNNLIEKTKKNNEIIYEWLI